VNIRVVLELLEEVEQKMADLYTWCAREYREDEEAEKLFIRLTLEENAHKNLILYQRRMASRNPKAYDDININPKTIKKCIQQVEFFQQKKGKSSLSEAVEFALQIESSAAESHFPDLIAESNAEMKHLLTGLKAGDERHIGWLKEFAKTLGH